MADDKQKWTRLRPCGRLPVTPLVVPKSVLIVDDNASIRQGLCKLFKLESDFEVCGEAQNGKEAIEKAQELHPDLGRARPFHASDERV